MKKSLYIYVFLFIGTALFASCGNHSEDSDDSPLVINIPEADDECCSYDDELAMRRLFADYQEVAVHHQGLCQTCYFACRLHRTAICR